MPEIYSRRVSTEESREGYLLVEKARLAFFPPPGTPFELVLHPDTHAAAVESYACQCRGPQKPHEHYFVRVPGLAKGERVTIHREGAAYVIERG